MVLAEPDWEGLVLDEPEPALLRRATTAVVAARSGSTIGRRLRRLLVDERFDDVRVEAIMSTVTEFAFAERLILGPILEQGRTLGAVEDSEVATLLQELQGRDRRSAFFLALPTFIASATRL